MVYVGAKITIRVTVKQNSQISGCEHSSLKLDPLGVPFLFLGFPHWRGLGRCYDEHLLLKW